MTLTSWDTKTDVLKEVFGHENELVRAMFNNNLIGFVKMLICSDCCIVIDAVVKVNI